MRAAALVLTGTSGSGKTTVARQLAALHPRVQIVRAVTTRASRQDDAGEYDYLSDAQFNSLRTSDSLLLEAQYGDHQYGIKKAEYRRAVSSGAPVLVLTPDTAIQLADRSSPGEEFLTVYLDAPDAQLDQRLAVRSSYLPTAAGSSSIAAQRSKDREQGHHAYYEVQNVDLDITTQLVWKLWRLWGTGGVLSKELIDLMLRCDMLLEDADPVRAEGASYDLQLGDEYFQAGRIRQLSAREPFLLVEPYDYSIVTSRERSKFPRDVCGRFDLSVGLFCQGIILSNGPQVDPGFRGRLFCLLFNTSSSPVLLRRGQHYATLELHRLVEPTAPYSGTRQDKEHIVDYLPTNATTGAINELKKELEQVRADSRSLQTVLFAFISLTFAVIALVVSSQ